MCPCRHGGAWVHGMGCMHAAVNIRGGKRRHGAAPCIAAQGHEELRGLAGSPREVPCRVVLIRYARPHNVFAVVAPLLVELRSAGEGARRRHAPPAWLGGRGAVRAGGCSPSAIPASKGRPACPLGPLRPHLVAGLDQPADVAADHGFVGERKVRRVPVGFVVGGDFRPHLGHPACLPPSTSARWI